MALKHFFWLRWFDYTKGIPIEKRIEVNPNRSLGTYYTEFNLWAVRKRCRVVRLEDSMTLRHYYTPQSGDVIQLKGAS